MLGLLLAIAALILGIVGVVEGGLRNWAAWGVICLAVLHLVSQL